MIIAFGRQPLHSLSPFVHAVVDDNVVLEPAHVGVQVLAHLMRPGVLPFPIEPEHPDITVIRHQFPQLTFHVCHVTVEIRTPGRLSGTCWAWANSTYVTGDLSLLGGRAGTAGAQAATPGAPGTPQAAASEITFSTGGLRTVNSVHLTYCDGLRAAIFGVRNRQAWAFESARITVEDLTGERTLFGRYISDDPFLPDSRSCSPTLDRLAAGSRGFAGGTLDAALVPGHRVHGTFDFCSQEGLAGTCIQEVVEFIVP